MAKPFSIQSPEQIAKEYAGNKQKIAQAMHLGIVDPTAGVLAGMFIDRMRSAQTQEAAAPPTVAQQVMGGPAPAPSAPLSPAGGLGATPQAAPPMAPMTPDMPAMGAPEGAPMGMAAGGMVPPYAMGGGLSDMPIPDTMFDEPSNGGFDDGYAGGGIVAFAGGSPGRRMTDEEYIKYILQRESGGRDYRRPGVPLTSGAGAKYAMQVHPGTAMSPGYGVSPAKADTPEEYNRVGREYALALRQKYGDEGGLAAYNMGPGAYEAYMAGKQGMPTETRKYISGVGAARDSGTPAPTGGLGATPPTGGLFSAIPGAFKAGEEYYAANMPERKNEGLGLLTEAARKTLDPAEQKKRRDEDKWMMLAEIGFNMASSNSPYLLQAAGAAAAAALPGARAAKKEREADKREAIRDLAAAEDITYKQAAEKTKFVTDFAAMQLGIEKDDLARSTDVWKTIYGENAATTRTGMQVQGQKDVAGITAASYANTAERQEEMARRQAAGRASAAALAEVNTQFSPMLRPKDPIQAKQFDDQRDAFYQQRYAFYLQSEGFGGAAAPGAPSAGQGRVVSQGKIISAVPIPQ